MSNNPYEEINPSQVILDPEFAQTATSDDIINPAEVVLDPEFAQTAAAPAAAERSDREKLRQVFTSDPLAFISDPNQRRALEMSINASDNPDEVRQKIAVAAFYSNANSAQTGFIFDNFDRSMELAVGRATTPDAEYTKIAEVVRDQKFLPEDTQQYTERLQQNKDAGNAVIRAVVGMGKNIGVGMDTALLNFATFFKLLSGRPGSGRDAMGNYRATGWFGAQQSAAIDAAQPELARVKSEKEIAKRSAFAKAYRVDELGIPALPLEPVWSSKPFGSAMDEENKQIWEHYYRKLKADKSFDFLPENVSTYAELEKLYTDEVKKRYAEKFGSADNADQEFDRAATRADWKAEAASKDIFNEIDYDQVWGKINQWNGYFRDQFNANADAYHPGDIDKDTLKMMVESGDYGQVIGKSLAMCFDQVALSIIPMLMTSNLAKPLGTLATPATTAAFGAQMYGQGAAEFAAAKAADVEAIKANVDSYAAMYSAAETIPEMLLGWIPLSKQILNMGKPTREVLKQKLVNGIWDYGKGFVKAGASDTMGEMITFGVEKILDAVYDVNLPGGKNWEDLTDTEKAEFMQDGALETVVVSMLTAGSGGIVGTAGKRQTIAEKNLRKERVRQVLDARINELANKDVLTDEENSELKQLLTITDASNLDSAITAAQKIITRQALEPVNIIAETANPDIPLDVVENANNALIRNKISNAVFWDVNQTIRQAQELTRQFPGFALTVYNSHTDMPADLRQRVEAAGMTPSRVQAFIMPDSNDVILIANKVPPSQVAKVIGHEIIGHRGIRAVFGEDYDKLLDLVYRDHVAEIDQLAGAYARNPKNNLENQRYLTEEYLGNCADAKVKPSWWKELIAKIRAWLRKRFPKMRFTDKDIEGVLSMATRHLRKNSVVRDSRTAEGNTGDAGNTNLRFMSVNETGFNGNERDLTGDDKAFPERTENEYTAVRNVLRSIQGNILNNEDTGIKAKLSSTGVNKMLSNKARDKSKNNGFEDAEHLQAAANIDRLFANAVLTEDRPDKNNDPNIVSIKRFSAPFYTGRGFAEARLTVKESIEHGNRIYSLELDEIKKPSSPDKGGLDKQANTPALDGYNKLIQKIENASAKIKNNSKNDNLPVSLADPDNLVLVASPAETVSQAREYATSIDLAAAGKTDVDIYGNKLSEIFEDWDSADPMTREAWMRDYYEDEMREAESHDRLESDFAQKDAFRNAFDVIEDKISAALDEYDLTIDRSNINASGDSFYISFEDDEGESYTLRFSNHQQPARGSYRTSNARETSGIGGSRSVADVSVVLDNGAFDLTPAMEFIARIGTGAENTDIRFSVAPVYTGSAADYDQPSLQYINSGEGAQVYGWGLYGSSSREVAEWYAYSVAKGKNAGYNFEINGETFTPDTTPKDNVKRIIWLRVIQNDIESKDDLLKALKQEQKDRKHSWDIYGGEGKYFPPGFLDEIADAIQLVKDGDVQFNKNYIGKRNLYKQTFWPGKNEVLLDWNERVPEDIRQKIADQAVAEGLPFAYTENGKNVLNESGTGEFVYKALTKPYNQLGSAKAVSEFLYRAGIDGITYIGDSSGVRNYVAFADADIRVDEHIKFMLSEYSADQTADIVAVLRPYVGYYLAKDDADYQAHLKSLGIDVDVHDAHAFAVLAMRENQADQAARSAEKRKKTIEARNKARSEYLYNSIPLYREAIDFAGTEDFKIKPSEKFWPEEFSGSFISKEFIDYSKSKKKDKSKLYNASGINSNEFAESLARKWGRDALEVEQEIIDFFRDLKKRDLYKEYSDFRNESLLADKEANRLAAEEFKAQEKFRIENEVIGILEGKRPVTEEFVKENRQVYNELYRQVMKAEPPKQPRKHDIETLNAAVQNDSFDAAAFAAAYKTAREESAREYMDKLRDLREKVMENKADAVALQREAGNFVRKNLPRELQGSFIHKIVKLLDYSTTPNPKYPDGHRRFMFDQMVKEITEKANKLRKDKAIAEIHRLLDNNRTKRTAKNVPYSPMGARQGFLDRINHISRLKPENIVQLKLFALENADAIQERLDQLMDWKNEDANDPQNIERNELENDLLLNDREISILENFGALELKTADAVEKSLQLLKDFIFAGRNEFKAAMDERSQRIREDREKIRLEMTDGNLNVDHRNDLDMSLDKYKEFILANLSDGQLMRNFSRIDDEVKFYKSAHGKLYRMIESATLQENNFLRDAQNRLNEFYKTHGLTAGKLGKFLKKLTTVQDTGIVVPVYGVAKPAQIQPKGAATPKEEMVYYGDESHGRPKKRAFVELEHTRKILEDIQDGIPISGVLQIGGLQNTIDLRNELKQAGFNTGRYFTVAVTANGYRIYTDTDNQEVRSFDLDKNNIDINRLLPAIAAILEANPDAVFPLDEFALDSAKNKIIEYDGGMAARRTFDYGDDIDNAAMEAYFGSEENSILKSRKIEISTASQQATKRDKVLKISPEVAVQIILTAEQDSYKTNMKFNGFTDDKINELKAWVEKTLPGALELGYAVRQIVQDQRQELNKAVANRYGVALPDTPNFWYANFGGGVKDAVQDAGYGNPIGGLTVSANFLTARRYHTLPVDTQVGFMSLFMRKQLETAHFIAWSEPVRELRSIYSNLEVQNNLIKEFGHEAWQLWKKRIELLATGGDPGNVWSQFFNSMNQTFYPANIMLNVKSIVTQLAGGVSYSLYVPTGEITKRLGINRDTPEYHHFMSMVKASGYLENRALGGLDPSLKGFLMPFAKRKDISPMANKLMKTALAGNTWADRNGALYWGYMCYDYFRKLGLKRKMSAQDARKFAFDMWMRATDETQQSGEMKDLNSFNMNPGILRAITAYMTSPMQQFGLELSSIMRYMKNKSPEAKQEMIRRIVVNHIVNTTVMNLLASAFRHGINFGDYLDDWEDYVFGWLFGSLDSVAVVGKILKNLFTGQYFGTHVQLFPVADNIARDVQKISADIQGKSKVQLLDYLQAAGDLLMSAGPPMTRMVGAALYVSSRETKRIMRWFEDEKLGK